MTPTPANAPVKPSALPLIALILGIVGFCFPPLFLIAIILAIVSLANGQNPAYAARKTLSILTLALGVAYVPMVGILAAIAIPNFIKFQTRAKQSECKMNLKSAYNAQEAFYVENARWGTSLEEIGFSPGGKTNYEYRIDLHEKLMTMSCEGNIDKDATVDTWSIANDEREIRGERVPAGVPFNETNDVSD